MGVIAKLTQRDSEDTSSHPEGSPGHLGVLWGWLLWLQLFSPVAGEEERAAGSKELGGADQKRAPLSFSAIPTPSRPFQLCP